METHNKFLSDKKNDSTEDRAVVMQKNNIDNNNYTKLNDILKSFIAQGREEIQSGKKLSHEEALLQIKWKHSI